MERSRLGPGIVGQQCLHACYDCLCLMALFRDVMLLVHDWAALSTWTGTKTGYCRTVTWDEWQIEELEVVETPSGSDDIRFQRCDDI